MNFISGFFIKSYKQTGKLTLSDKKISFINNSVDLTDIHKIIVRANNYYGEAHTGMYIGVGSAYPKEGINNFIVLQLKNEKIYKFQILFRYTKDINIMYKIFYFYYKSGINIEFYQKNKRIL
ncbi:MAG: hypothetical protein GXO80_02515 [Chlorobi bacterium]|nr:hypothetical protein [Chlorobiota bacterium]